MARWQDVVDTEPAFAKEVQSRFDAHTHKMLATLRKDGSPRISGIELTFADGDMWLGMMPDSFKVKDLRRDPRFALHTTSEDPPEGDPSGWSGDAKVSGVAVEVTDPQERARALGDMNTGGQPGENIPIFRLDLNGVVLMRLGEPADHMLIETWKPDTGIKAARRK